MGGKKILLETVPKRREDHKQRRNIESIKQVSEDDRVWMDVKITEEEVGETLKSTKNNIAPGHGGFSGSFYKVFWKFLKNIVVNAINEIYENDCTNTKGGRR